VSPIPTQSADRSVPAGYITEVELADQLGVTFRTIRTWRHQGEGPPVTWLGRGRRPAYRIQAVEEWLKARERKMPRERSSRQITREHRAT
jgi:phage terminase Nu1 subunit (DNA packaging protein)